MMKRLRFPPLLLVATLAACTSVSRQPIATFPQSKPTQAPRAAEEHSATPPTPSPPAENSGRTAKRPSLAPASSPAVLALLQEAEADSASGSLDNAATALERAIRIQPRNAQLWHKLAEVRLKQYQPGLAEDLAKKSNVLAKDNKALARQNWAIIAEARRKKGDTEGAAAADAKAGR